MHSKADTRTDKHRGCENGFTSSWTAGTAPAFLGIYD